MAGQASFTVKQGGVLPKQDLAVKITNSEEEFRRYFKSEEGRAFLEPRDPQMAQPASWDLKVGGLACSLTEGREVPSAPYTILPKSDAARNLVDAGRLIDVVAEGGVTIRPGEACVIWTRERIALPLSLCALVTTKSSMAARGLMQVTSRIDPGFASSNPDGLGFPLQIPIFNGGTRTAQLNYERPFANLVFFTMSAPSAEGHQGSGTGGISTTTFDESGGLEAKEPEKLLNLLRNRSYEAEVIRVLIGKMLRKQNG